MVAPPEAPASPPRWTVTDEEVREAFTDPGWAATLRDHFASRSGRLLYFDSDLGLTRAGKQAFALTLAAWTHGIPRPRGWDDAQVDAMADWIEARRGWPGSASQERALRMAMLRLDGELYRHLRQLEEAQWDQLRQISRYRLPAPLPAERLHAELVPHHPEYERLRAAYVHFHDLAAAGALEPVRDLPTWTIRKGRRHPAVPALRRRLASEGFGPQVGHRPKTAAGDRPENPDRLDRELSLRLRQYQLAHGLDRTGQLDAATAEVLAEPPEAWLRRLELGLARGQRSEARQDPDHLRVNIPQYEVQVVEDGAVTRRFEAIVGHVRTRTPIKQLTLDTVKVHPTFFGTDARLPIAAGPMNPLGPVMLRSVERSELIYLHGTNQPQLFKRAYRALSHGCIRLADPVGLIGYLLDRDPAPVGSADLAAMLDAEEKGKLHLTRPVTAYLEYNTTFAAGDGGHVVFARDVYFQDVHPLRRLRKRPLAIETWEQTGSDDAVAAGR